MSYMYFILIDKIHETFRCVMCIIPYWDTTLGLAISQYRQTCFATR